VSLPLVSSRYADNIMAAAAHPMTSTAYLMLGAPVTCNRVDLPVIYPRIQIYGYQ